MLVQQDAGDRDGFRARVIKDESEVRPGTFGQLELKSCGTAGLPENRVAREQRASGAFRSAGQGSGFEKFRRRCFEAECREPAAQVQVNFDARSVRFEECLPAFLRTKRPGSGTRLFDQIGNLGTGGVEQAQIRERALRGVMSLRRQRHAHQAGRGHIEALAGRPVVQWCSVSLGNAENSQQNNRGANCLQAYDDPLR